MLVETLVTVVMVVLAGLYNRMKCNRTHKQTAREVGRMWARGEHDHRA